MAVYKLWEQGTGWVDASTAGFTASPLTTKGDVWGYSTADARIPVGADGDVLTADSTQPLGLKWAAGGGGGVTSLDSITGAVSLVAGSNVTITDNSPSAGDITIAASGAGGGGLVSLFDQTLASAAASIDTGASGIASGHGDLIVILYARVDDSGYNSVAVDITFNGDTGANYDLSEMRNNNGTVDAPSAFGRTSGIFCNMPGPNLSTDTFGIGRMTIAKYGVTTSGYKIAESVGGYVNSSNYQTQTILNMWHSTAAINQITVTDDVGGNFVAGSRLVIYGAQ